ncbi:hypothetical protein ACN6LC_004699 [Streptomyces violaceoruber]
MDDELTNDDHLRALAALEAVVQNDDGALKALVGGTRERPLAACSPRMDSTRFTASCSPRSASRPP